MNPLQWRERVVFAYIDEPPFAWTNPDGTPSGCDVAVALTILKSLDIKQIAVRRVTFPELIPGVADHQWTVNTPIFITPERGKLVRFSRPVWALADGLMVRLDAPPTLNGYAAIAQNDKLKLGVVRDQVQHQTALRAGISSERIRVFETQDEVISALLNEQVDAYAATAMGHRAYIHHANDDRLAVVEAVDADGNPVAPAFGAYSFAQTNTDLADAFDRALATYIGSSGHRTVMQTHGFSQQEIDLVVAQYKS